MAERVELTRWRSGRRPTQPTTGCVPLSLAPGAARRTPLRGAALSARRETGGEGGIRTVFAPTTEKLRCAGFELSSSEMEQEERCSELQEQQDRNRFADKSAANVGSPFLRKEHHAWSENDTAFVALPGGHVGKRNLSRKSQTSRAAYPVLDELCCLDWVRTESGCQRGPFMEGGHELPLFPKGSRSRLRAR
jgi:hypothetical protein